MRHWPGQALGTGPPHPIGSHLGLKDPDAGAWGGALDLAGLRLRWMEVIGCLGWTEGFTLNPHMHMGFWSCIAGDKTQGQVQVVQLCWRVCPPPAPLPGDLLRSQLQA